uniref:FH2 domain-containing protein n=1 Tax=Anisakis simplex TaxID=6269 RepID=A0A0M3J283_ANISI
LSTDPSAITQCDDKTFLNNIRNLPSATVDVKRGVAIKLENTNGSNNNSTDMDTCVSSSASMVEESNRSISVANSVTPNGNCFGLTSPLNCLKNQRSLESILRLRTGENLQPRYLLHKLNWHVLDDEQISNTVFDTFNTLNTQGIMEKLDLTQFEPLVEESTFLNEEQLEKIAEVRRQINLQTFEIMYAVHRLDLGVLSAENVDLVTSIAPSAVDIHRFKNYEMSNSVSTLGENEQFVLQLSKIERMEEKLQAMSHMSKFANRVSTLNQQFSDFLNAAKLLHTSTEFHYILQILLTCGNLISGDFNAQIIKGFRTSSLVDQVTLFWCCLPSLQESVSQIE